jgi:hypothetical protein
MTHHTQNQGFSMHRGHHSLPQLFALCIAQSSDMVDFKRAFVFATVLTPIGIEPLHKF